MVRSIVMAFTFLLCSNACASWTLAVLPDTQNYATIASPIFAQQTQWIVDNKDTLGIQMVLQQGDVTNLNTPAQWDFAKNAMSTLDGQVPYMIATGSHDYFPTPYVQQPTDYSLTMLNDYFSLDDNPLNNATVEMTPGELENTYNTFVAPDGRKMLVFSLEFLPRPEVMVWAGGVADLFPDYTAIFSVHSNIGEGPAVSGEPTAIREYTGQILWDGLTGQKSSIEMVLNAHKLDSADTDPNGPLTTARQSSLGINGNLVQEVVFNSQEQPNGGNGYLRLYEFMDDGTTVQVRTYSPTLDVWLTNDRNEFQFTLTPLDPLLVWQNNYGTTTDGYDFLAWQLGVSGATGVTASPSVAVPEPSTIALALLILAILRSTRSCSAQANEDTL